MSHWTEADIPDQHGRVAVVTGANTGIGFETARALADRGATVVLACRNPDKAEEAAARIGGAVEAVRLDLASLASVRAAAAVIGARHARVDLLINNAGLTGLKGVTEDGFEMHFGVNHLGHFALTGLLLDRVKRVVTVSSIAHRVRGDYGKSKLANLHFTYALHRKLGVEALAAHPGGASTEVFRYSAAWFRGPNLLIAKLFGRTPAMGALPTLRAATDPGARGGEYYGPGGLFEIGGYPVRVESSKHSHDIAAQDRLWAESERLTGVTY